jgi:hypothetical protein
MKFIKTYKFLLTILVLLFVIFIAWQLYLVYYVVLNKEYPDSYGKSELVSCPFGTFKKDISGPTCELCGYRCETWLQGF